MTVLLALGIVAAASGYLLSILKGLRTQNLFLLFDKGCFRPEL